MVAASDIRQKLPPPILAISCYCLFTAMEYYPKIGFIKEDRRFIINRTVIQEFYNDDYPLPIIYYKTSSYL